MEKINALNRTDRLSKTLRDNLAKRKEQIKARQLKVFENEEDHTDKKDSNYESINEEI